MTKNLVIWTKLFRLKGQNLIKNMDVFVSEKLGGSQLYKIIHARIFYHMKKQRMNLKFYIMEPKFVSLN